MEKILNLCIVILNHDEGIFLLVTKLFILITSTMSQVSTKADISKLELFLT